LEYFLQDVNEGKDWNESRYIKSRNKKKSEGN